MQLFIERDGGVRCIYSEAIALAELGSLQIERGSHVEPDVAGAWWADLSPVAGPKLGPFASRSQALSAEVDWLEKHWLSPIDGRTELLELAHPSPWRHFLVFQIASARRFALERRAFFVSWRLHTRKSP